MLTTHIESAWTLVIPLILNLLAVISLVFVGYLLARAAAFIVTFALQTLSLDKWLKKAGFTSILEKGDIKRTPAELVGDLFYWTILFVSIITASKTAALPIEIALDKIFTFLGLIFLASIILGSGLFFASLIASIIRLIAANFGIEGAKSFSRVIYYIVIVFAFLATLSQLGIGAEVFIPQMGVVIGAFGLAAAIAFGLGCKDMAADFLHNLFRGK